MTDLPNLQPDILEDDLVKIVPLTDTDFERLFAIATDPLIWELHPETNRYKREVFQPFFDGAVASETAFLIFDKATNDLIGSTRYYDYDPEVSKMAIGYSFLSRKYWGGQYNRAIKTLLLNYAFGFVDTVLFHIGATNLRSQRATAKLGAKKIGEFRHDPITNIADNYEYEIRKEVWEMNNQSKNSHK
jgi:RimJ/RimL family protein N-acetyltransferase